MRDEFVFGNWCAIIATLSVMAGAILMHFGVAWGFAILWIGGTPALPAILIGLLRLFGPE